MTSDGRRTAPRCADTDAKVTSLNSWPCAARLSTESDELLDAPEGCTGVVLAPPAGTKNPAIMYCSEYCRLVADVVRYRRRVEAEQRHKRVPDGELVLIALWRKESDVIAGSFYQVRLTADEREALFQAKGRFCVRCGAPATDVDHIDPAGGNELANLQPLCQACHLDKTTVDGGMRNVPPAVAREAERQLIRLLSPTVFASATLSGIGRVCVTADEPLARYAAYLERVYGMTPRACDDPEGWRARERTIRKERFAELRDAVPHGLTTENRRTNIGVTAGKESQMARNEVTGEKAGKAASKTMRNPKANKDEKSAAGSALTQRPPKGKGKAAGGRKK